MSHAGKKPHARKAKPKVDGDRMSKTAIANKLGRDRDTITRYLSMPGAPRPDKREMFSFKATTAFIEKHGSASLGESPEMRKMREEKMRLDLKALIRADKLEEGLLISKEEAGLTISPLMAELGELMRQKFVMELPTKAVGRSAADIQIMTELMLAEVIKRFKEGTSVFSANGQ